MQRRSDEATKRRREDGSDQVEFRSREAIRAHQLGALRSLLAAITPGNRFYAERLIAAGLDDAVESLEVFTDRMPFTHKTELARDLDEHPPYGTNLTYPVERYTRLHQTSSTTGAPLRWLDTAESWSWMLDGWQRVLEAAGVGPADRVLVPFGFGPFIGLWMAFDAASRMGCLTIPGGAMSSRTRLRVILENDVSVICCTPTYAIRLGEVAREQQIDLTTSSVRVLVLAGEPGASVPATRRRIEAAWPDARVFDHHGMTEVGPVTHECPVHPGRLHVLENSYICEVVDPETGASVSAGASKTGELVLTTLGRVGSPVLRYRTGDLVRPGPERRCDCGRTSASLEGGILGRVDEMVFVRGVNLYPSAVDQIVRSRDEVAEYRVRVGSIRGLTEVEIEIEPDPECQSVEDLIRSVECDLQNAYNLRVTVRAVPVGSLPRFELKARRWVRDG